MSRPLYDITETTAQLRIHQSTPQDVVERLRNADHTIERIAHICDAAKADAHDDVEVRVGMLAMELAALRGTS